MYQRITTKQGDVLFLKVAGEILGRHEIARIQFAKWDRKREHYILTEIARSLKA